MGKKVHKRPRLSQCMIVKNEERNIEKALSWGKGIVYEQIVVDTGSTDKTAEIAEQMGAKVFHFEWKGDFALAKNYAIEQASGDWIAFLDADEYFTAEDAAKLPDILLKIGENSKESEVIITAWLHLNDKGKVFAVNSQERIFRNKKELRYQNPVHESLHNIYGRQLHYVDAAKELSIYHTGYTEESYGLTGKNIRNIQLIKDVLKENPENWEYWGYLGNSLAGEKRYTEAAEAYWNVLDHLEEVTGPQANLTFTSFMKMIYEKGEEKGQPQDEMKAVYERYQEYGGISPDIDYWMGLWLMRSGNIQEAIYHLEKALELTELPGDGSPLYITGKLGEVYCLLAQAYHVFGDKHKSMNNAVLSLRINKYDVNAIMEVMDLFCSEPQSGNLPENVLQFLGKIYDLQKFKDKFFLLKAAQKSGYLELEVLLKQLFSDSEIDSGND